MSHYLQQVAALFLNKITISLYLVCPFITEDSGQS